MTPNDEALDSALGGRVRAGWAKFQSQRPNAAWAIWQGVLRERPSHKAATEAMETLARAHDLPDVARKPLRFLPPADEAARRRWDEAFRSSATDGIADPGQAALLFRELLDADPFDTAALWNLAVCLAWAGSNRTAVETLDRFVELASVDAPDRAADAWALAELLRHGAGAEDLADDVNLSLEVNADLSGLQFPPEEIVSALGFSEKYVEGATRSADIIAADLLKRPLKASDECPVPVAASAIVNGPVVRFSAPASPESGAFFRELADQVKFLSDQDAGYPQVSVGVLPLTMLDAAAARFRVSPDPPEARRNAIVKAATADFFERQWIGFPRVGLGGRTPLAASREASPTLRAKLEGIVQFQEQLARRPACQALYQDYDFDRLRYRLGLTTPPGKDDAKGEARHKALSLYDLNAVKTMAPEALSDDDLAVAWATASAGQDDLLAIRLGQALRDRGDAALGRVSLSVWAAPFLRRCLADGRFDEGLALLEFAIELDQRSKDGSETADLLVWKAQLATRSGDAERASAFWKDACAHTDAPPIRAYEAVIELWTLPEGTGPATTFAKAMTQSVDNAYVRALLSRAIDEADTETDER